MMTFLSLRNFMIYSAAAYIINVEAFCETFDASVGMESGQAIGANYKPKAISGQRLSINYTRPMLGRWSLLGHVGSNAMNSLTTGMVGLVFDSDDLFVKGGSIYADGKSEIVKVPIWLFRGMIGFGLVKYVDTLESTDASLGTKNQVPVQADLYGLQFSAMACRFLSPEWAATASFSYLSANAGGFGISLQTISVGALYHLK